MMKASAASGNAVLAKARALYGRRLRADDYRRLMGCRTMTELAAALKEYPLYADALAEVEKQQLVTVDEDGRYTITRRGTTVADTLAYDLPRTVRESAIRAVMQIRSWRHRAASNRAVVQEKDGQFSVVCSIADMGSDVFRMELAMPDKLTAEMIKNNFIAHGSDIFPKLLNALTQPGSEDDRPPAGLM